VPLTGDDGAVGDDGVDGSTLLSGAGAPSGGIGADGDFYIDTTAWEIYGPKATGVWGSGTSLIGADGDDGADGADGAALAGIVAESTTSRTLALTDAEKMIECSHVSGCEITVPANATVAFDVGAVVHIAADTSAAVTIVAAGGVTIKKSAAASAALAGQHSVATLAKVATDTWRLFGDLAFAS
jgi:hypothetical protein